MSRPFKHPKTGMYWLRRRVPVDLIAVVGKREELVSLRTKNACEAKERHLTAMAEVEKRWANLRVGPANLSEREALEIARELYVPWVERYRDEPSQQTKWRTTLFERLWQPSVMSEIALSLSSIDPTVLPLQEMRDLTFEGADTLLQRRGLRTDEAGRAKLAKAVGVVVQHASLALAAASTGCDVSPSLFASASQTGTPIIAAPKPAPSISFDEAIKLWIAEKQPRERTIYEWRRIFKELAGFVGHTDASRLTTDDLLRWKNAMLEAKRSPKTIRDAKIAPVRAILQVSVENRKLTANAAEKITMTVKRVAAGARRDFTEAEAIIILKAAMLEKSPTLRWVPWICAYSGARLSEACQLRREDVHQHEGIWIMRFAAEAGPLKNAGSERALPLHPALIESGFVDFVKTVTAGALFADLPPDMFGKRGGNGTKKIGRWVRKLGLSDTRLAPNHSWRHRFKTLGRRHDLRLDIVDAMTGHAAKSVGNAYGTYPMAAMLRELQKIPTLELEDEPTGVSSMQVGQDARLPL